MAIVIDKSASVYKPNQAIQSQQQLTSLQQLTTQFQVAGKGIEKQSQSMNSEVSLTLSKNGQKLSEKLSTVVDGETKEAVTPGKMETKPDGDRDDSRTGASYGSTIGAAAIRTKAVQSQLEALQAKQSIPTSVVAESSQKGNTIG